MNRAHFLLIPALSFLPACPDEGPLHLAPDAALTPADAAAADTGAADASEAADASVDAGAEIEEVIVCGPDHIYPEDTAPVPGKTMVQTVEFGFPLFTTELVLEGARRYRMIGPCVFLASPGLYAARLFSGGVEVAAGELDFEAERSVIVAVAGHPVHGARLRLIDWDFSTIGSAMWRMQFLNLAPETAGASMLIYAYPPGTPRTVPLDLTPALLGEVDFGEQLTLLVTPGTDMFAFVPSTSSATIATAALPALPCGAQHATEAFIIWCDTINESGDPGGPCAATLGAHIFLHTLEGERCN
jgi:hypothetical protein